MNSSSQPVQFTPHMITRDHIRWWWWWCCWCSGRLLKTETITNSMLFFSRFLSSAACKYMDREEEETAKEHPVTPIRIPLKWHRTFRMGRTPPQERFYERIAQLDGQKRDEVAGSCLDGHREQQEMKNSERKGRRTDIIFLFHLNPGKVTRTDLFFLLAC